jgi:hypothetical protein
MKSKQSVVNKDVGVDIFFREVQAVWDELLD